MGCGDMRAASTDRIENRYLNEGTPSWRPGRIDLTRMDAGFLPTEVLMELPSAGGEDALFQQSPTGRMMREAFSQMTSTALVFGL